MGKKGYLKIAMDKTAKKGNPFVSLLILENPADEEGTWMSLFDAWFFGGTDDKPSPYDIRRFADKDDPQPVVYEAEKEGKWTTCFRIRPESEKWEPPDGFATVKGEPKPIEKLIDEPADPYEGPLGDPIDQPENKIALAVFTLKQGLDLLEEALRE